jgi:hypothetical protein
MRKLAQNTVAVCSNLVIRCVKANWDMRHVSSVSYNCAYNTIDLSKIPQNLLFEGNAVSIQLKLDLNQYHQACKVLFKFVSRFAILLDVLLDSLIDGSRFRNGNDPRPLISYILCYRNRHRKVCNIHSVVLSTSSAITMMGSCSLFLMIASYSDY